MRHGDHGVCLAPRDCARAQPTTMSSKPKRKRSRHPFLAGGVSGGIEIMITYPLEFIKNSLQVQPGRFAGPMAAARYNIAKDGPLVLYRGLPSWLLFSFPKSAIRFTVFEKVSAELETVSSRGATAGTAARSRSGHESGQLGRDVAAGIIAGVVEAFTCLTPCQNLSIKMTHDANRPPGEQKYARFFPGAAKIMREVGVRGMLAGAGPTMFKGAINQSIRFPLFHVFSRKAQDWRQRDKLRLWENWLCGAGAGGVSAVASHPVDVVKANMMGLRAARFGGSSVRCARLIWAEHGFGGFFLGLGPRLARVCAEVGLLFALFQSISDALDEALPAD